jgi:hypothetical protein
MRKEKGTDLRWHRRELLDGGEGVEILVGEKPVGSLREGPGRRFGFVTLRPWSVELKTEIAAGRIEI